jgi:Zn-dependent protease
VFGRAWRIGSIGGVAIRIDSSWALIVILVTYSLWLQFTSFGYGLSDTSAFLMALLASALFFGSVLIHELAHAGMAKARGIHVSGITLFLFGGATSARMEDKGPFDEFLVTAVGPGSSFALAGIFLALSHGVGRPLSISLDYAARINFILAVFNLVPGFPLDGGRILRSAIWRATGNLDRATRIAAGAGQIVGMLFIAGGIAEAVTGGTPEALWLAMIGFFLLQAARSAVAYQRSQRALSQGFVREVMGPPPPAIPAAMSLSQSLDSYLRGHEDESFPVIDDDRVVGLLTFDAARALGQVDPLRPVRDAMLPLTGVATVRVGDRLDGISDRLGPTEVMVLDEEGRLVGTISPAHLSRWLHTNQHS